MGRQAALAGGEVGTEDLVAHAEFELYLQNGSATTGDLLPQSAKRAERDDGGKTSNGKYAYGDPLLRTGTVPAAPPERRDGRHAPEWPTGTDQGH